MPYDVNRSVSKPLEFKGLVGDHIIILIVGIVVLFILFFIMRFTGMNSYLILAIITGLTGGFLVWLARFSKKFGAHGFDKHIAAKRCPRFILNRKTTRALLKKRTSDDSEKEER